MNKYFIYFQDLGTEVSFSINSPIFGLAVMKKMERSTKQPCCVRVGNLLSAILWTSNGFMTSIEDMRINHRGLDILVAEEFLNCANIIVSFEQVGREGVPESVWCNSFI
jgi:hypothetical protein